MWIYKPDGSLYEPLSQVRITTLGKQVVRLFAGGSAPIATFPDNAIALQAVADLADALNNANDLCDWTQEGMAVKSGAAPKAPA